MNTRIRTVFCCLLLLIAQATSLHAQQSETQKPPEPPLSREQLLSLVRAGVTSIDILGEAENRGLDYYVDAQLLEELQAQGADELLLNMISFHSRPATHRLIAELIPLFESNVRQCMDKATQLLEDCPRHVGVMWLQARAAMKTGNWDAARKGFARLASIYADYRMPAEIRDVKLNPQRFSIPTWQALVESACDDHAALIAICTRELDRSVSPEMEIFLLRGHSHEHLGRYEESARDYLDAVKAFPDHAAPYVALAVLQAACPTRQFRNLRSAMDLATTAIELADREQDGDARSEQRSAALRALAIAQAAGGDFAAAKLSLAKGLELASDVRKSEFEELMTAFENEKPFQLQPPSDQPSEPVPDILKLISDHMISVAGGEVRMGSPNYPLEQPVHTMNVSPFLISDHEVTNQEWALVLELPVIGDPQAPKQFVSWNDCQQFLTALNSKLGSQVFRLPTEAEWEFACRAGSDTVYFFGDSANDLDRYAVYANNADSSPSPVRQKEPNGLGLYDVYGNVAEWCSSPFQRYPLDSENPRINRDFYIHRGGSAFNAIGFCRSSSRAFAAPHVRLQGLGFRLAANPVPDLATLVLNAVPETPEALDVAISEQSKRVRQVFGEYEKQRSALNLAKLHLARGFARYKRDDYAGAVKDFEETLDNSPKPQLESPPHRVYLVASTWLAWVLATAPDDAVRNAEDAERYADRILQETQSKHWLPHIVRAAAYAELGSFDRAVTDAELAVKLASDEHKELCETWLNRFRQRTTGRGSDLPLKIYYTSKDSE